MSELPSVNGKQAISAFENNGFAVVRVSGSHHIMKKPDHPYVLSVPVFFDTVFYLLVPLARSMTRRTGKYYLKYALAIAAGGVITHSLVPPTPGPLFVAGELGVSVGVTMLAGIAVWIVIALIIIALIFRLFMFYVGTIYDAMEPL